MCDMMSSKVMWPYKLSYEVTAKVAQTTIKFLWYSTDAENPATATAAVTYNTTERALENKHDSISE